MARCLESERISESRPSEFNCISGGLLRELLDSDVLRQKAVKSLSEDVSSIRRLERVVGELEVDAKALFVSGKDAHRSREDERRRPPRQGLIDVCFPHL